MPSTEWNIQCDVGHDTKLWRRQRKRNLHQGTVVVPVLGSTISTVRRRRYRNNVVLHRSMQGSYCRANASQYLTAPWVPYVDNGTGTTGVPQNSIKNHHDGNNPSTQQSTQKKPFAILPLERAMFCWWGRTKKGRRCQRMEHQCGVGHDTKWWSAQTNEVWHVTLPAKK